MPTSSASTSKTKKSAGKKTSSKSSGPRTRSSSSSARSAATRTPARSTAGINSYPSALRWLMSQTNYERMRLVSYNQRTFNLDRMKVLLDVLGNPHEQLKCVHVAGSKGKGSACAMLSSMLQASGCTVGLYSSPHLVDLRERIQIDGHMISQHDLTEILKRIARKQKSFGENPPTFFDIMTGAALKHFADQAVDVAVLETGLGGRLDSTNAITPVVCGLTQISLDHTNILGREITQIAREKAGILKPGVPAVSTEQLPEVQAVFDEVAQEVGAPLEYTGQQIEFSYRFEATRDLGPHTRVSVTTPLSRWEHLAVPLRGEHQALNCGLALALLDKLRGAGFEVADEKIVEGLAATKLPGRMEQIHQKPRVLVDGAHNAASIQALIRSLGAHISYDSLVVIFGCGQDKDVPGMLKQLSLGADKVIFTKAASNPRAMEPGDLISRFNELSGKMSQQAESLEEAVRLAGRAVGREDLIVITGSFYLVGEAKQVFARHASARRSR